MKSTFARFSHGAATKTEAFQAETAEWKSAVSTARNVLRVRSRANFCDFVEGPLLMTMQCTLLQDFTGAGENFEKFSSDVVSILADVREGAEEAFVARIERGCRRGSPKLTSYDWDALKTDLDHRLKAVAPHIAELQMAVTNSRPASGLIPHHH